MSAHANCTHEITPAARAACRKARAAAIAARATLRNELITVLNEGFTPRPNHWIFAAAYRFGATPTNDVLEAADAILDYFLPSGDADKDAYRARNGYTITADVHLMRSIILRAFS